MTLSAGEWMCWHEISVWLILSPKLGRGANEKGSSLFLLGYACNETEACSRLFPSIFMVRFSTISDQWNPIPRTYWLQSPGCFWCWQNCGAQESSRKSCSEWTRRHFCGRAGKREKCLGLVPDPANQGCTAIARDLLPDHVQMQREQGLLTNIARALTPFYHVVFRKFCQYPHHYPLSFTWLTVRLVQLCCFSRPSLASIFLFPATNRRYFALPKARTQEFKCVT